MKETHAVYSTKTKVMLGICWALLLLLAALMVFPAIYIILGSFKSNAELLVGGTKIFPSEWRVDNYTEAWQQANFARYTLNSVFLAVGVMVLSLISSTMAGYVFSRKELISDKTITPSAKNTLFIVYRAKFACCHASV